METKKDKIDEFIQKTLNMKKQDRMDLSSDEDLSIAIMNLVSMEEHFFFTGAKTGDDSYYDLLNQVRSMRKDLLKRIIKDYKGEVWCISKHLLAASMRLMEYGSKLLSMGKKEDAKEMFQKAYDLYSLFWGLNLNLIDVKDVKKIEASAINKHDTPVFSKITSQKKETKPAGGFFGKLGDLVRKAIDCCIE